MDDLSNATTFIGLLKLCRRVEVPLIQRDYAQGRENQAQVRIDFLNALHSALDTQSTQCATPMNLDFIYGSMEENDDGIYFLPLDGQQRLTTLFLLHWYLAWRDERLTDFQILLLENGHSRFGYKVRPSSAEFFDDLVRFSPNIPPEAVPSIRKLLEDQHWFFLNWRLDPTIQSALTMLEAIHKKFSASRDLFARLLDEEHPAITFQLLRLEHFGLSDDLYIKMNARGKPLTAFETFKARFEEDLKVLFPTEKKKIGDISWKVRDFFALRMDTQWAALFWQYRADGTTVFDTEVMNLFWTIAQLSLDPEKKSFVKDTTILQNKQAIVNYSAMKEGGWLTIEFTNQLIALLEAWSVGGGKITRQMAIETFFDEEAIFKKLIKTPAALNYTEILQFSAFVLYLKQWQNEVKADELREWMRVVSNLAANTNYDHVEVFQRCMLSLRKLLPESRKILVHLSELDATRISGFSPQQVQEEVIKAKLLLADVNWRARIETAEGHGYFDGQIEFLLDFTGLEEAFSESDPEQQLSFHHKARQSDFDDFLIKAQLTFNKDGLVDPAGASSKSYLWQRALLSIGDYLLPAKLNQSFGTNVADNVDSWKRFLRGGKNDAINRRMYLKLLWRKLDTNSALRPQLEQIIASAKDLESWRAEIVRNPQVIDFCLHKNIRKVNDKKVYLLKKLQMNGAHAELFSYSLYTGWNTISSGQGAASLSAVGYSAVSESAFEPQFILAFDLEKIHFIMAIEYRHSGLKVVVNRNELSKLPEVEMVLRNELGFSENSTEFVGTIENNDAVKMLRDMNQTLYEKLNKNSIH